MKQNRDELSMEDIYSFITDNSQSTITAEEKLNSTTAMIEKYVALQRKNARKELFATVFLMIVVLVSLIVGIYSASRTYEQDSRLELTEQLIQKNASGGINYRVKNGVPVTYQELMLECDSLHKVVVSTQEKLYTLASSAVETGAVEVDYTKWLCSSTEIWDYAKKVITNKEGHYSIYLRTDGQIATFEEIIFERDSLQDLSNYYKYRLSIAERKYGIKISDHGGIPDVKSERVDSALLLLPYYKDRIERTKEGYWAVHTYSNK